MKTLTMMITVGLAAALSAGCDDDTTPGDMGAMDLTAAADLTGAFPAPPTLGSTQIDRMGRAGVNTALTAPFYNPMDATQKADHEAKQDAYNKAPQSMWQTFVPEIAGNLAILDGLDGECGNQPLANPSGAADGGASTGEYGTLASVLANDELLLAPAVPTCAPTSGSNYLAVEVAVITSGQPSSCGGRTPLDNTIDVTYAILSGGYLNGKVPTNGVTADADTANVANLSTFPFLGAPNP